MKQFALIKMAYHESSVTPSGMSVVGTFDRENDAYTAMRVEMASYRYPETAFCVMKLHFFEQNNRIIEATEVVL